MLRRDPRVAEVELDGVALVASAVGAVLQLDERARLLWSLCDGRTTLGELADDVAHVFGIAREVAFADVGQFVATLLSQGMLVGEDVGPIPAGPTPRTGAHALGVPPVPCGSDLEDTEFGSTTRVRVGDRILGIRTNLDLVDAAIRELLARHLLDTPGEAHDNVSIVWTPPNDVRPQPLLDLYVQHHRVARTTSSATIRRLLALELTALASTTRAGLLWLGAIPVVGPAGAVLLGPHQAGTLQVLRAALAPRGWAVGGSMAAVDVARMEVVLRDDLVDPTDSGRVRFDQLSEWHDDGPPPVAAGRYPLRAFGVVPPLPEGLAADERGWPGGVHPSARVLAPALPLVGGLEDWVVPQAVEAVLRIAAAVPTDEPPAETILDWLAGALEPGAGRRARTVTEP